MAGALNPSAAMYAALSAPADVPTLYDENTVAIAVVDGSVVINDVATVITPDVLASNGVIHVIDAVLVPAS